MRVLNLLMKHDQFLKCQAAVVEDEKVRKITEKERDVFLSLLNKAHYFYIHKKAILGYLSDQCAVNKTETGAEYLLDSGDIEKIPFESPFEIVWMELISDDDKVPMFMSEDKVAPIGMLIHDRGSVYDVWAVEATKAGPNFRADFTLHRNISKSSMGSYINVEAKIWTETLSHSVTGEIHNQNVIRIRGLGKPKAIPVRKVVVITDKTYKGKPTVGGFKVVEWSHRWEVRGHWRKCNGIGKNKNGDYIVHGLTWVNEHIRGPETEELIEKVRVRR